jgi:hypothetical protein
MATAEDRPAGNGKDRQPTGAVSFVAAQAVGSAEAPMAAETPAADADAQGNASVPPNVSTPRAAEAPQKERFIPVTRFALIDRLTRQFAWPGDQAASARRFFRYLDFWRQQSYAATLLKLEQDYEPFSPDSDLLVTRKVSPQDREKMQDRLIENVKLLLQQANFEQIDPKDIEIILTTESHYGLDLFVEMEAFDEILIYYRGATKDVGSKRTLKKLYLHKEEFDIPIYQRLFVLFKLKPFDARVRELMDRDDITEKQATKLVNRNRRSLPKTVSSDNVYLKLFKNIPRTDMEMCFPNTIVRFRMLDKVKLGVMGGGGTVAGLAGAVPKILAATTNPVTAIIALGGFGGVLARQVFSFLNQQQRYMVVMAQNLYFHSMADNRGVMTLLADRALEEDVKEEILLYSVLAKERVHRDDLDQVRIAIEQYLLNAFGVDVLFDAEDALQRLVDDDVVTISDDGYLDAKSPHDATLHIDDLWDNYLDKLPDPVIGEGHEMKNDATAPPTTHDSA